MVLIDRELTVRRLDYRRGRDGSAVVRLLARLPLAPQDPLGAQLVVVDDAWLVAPVAQAAVRPARRAGVEWEARFVVPGSLLAPSSASFTLLAADGSALALPAPVLREDVLRSLAVALRRSAMAGRLPVTGRRLAAAATLAAMLGTSAPGLALADGGSLGSPQAGQTAASPSAPAADQAPSGQAPSGQATAGRPRTRSGAGPEATIRPPDCRSRTALASVTFTTQAALPAAKPEHAQRPLTCTPTSALEASHAHRPGHDASRRVKHAAGRHAEHHSTTTTRHSSSAHAHRSSTATSSHRVHHATSGGGGSLPAAPPRPAHHSPPSPTQPTSGGATTPVGGLSPTPPYHNPSSWTGIVAPNPSLTGLVHNLAGLLSDGDRPPSFLIPIYMQAGRRYGVPWEVLAAINAIESDYGNDLSTSSAGAIGWMQFEPSTWRQWGVAVDGHSVPNPYDPRDAIFSAARYLQAAGAAHDLSRAIFAYNHAQWYVDDVLTRAQAIARHAQYMRAQVSRAGIFSVYFSTGLAKHPAVRYTGGVLSHFDRLIAAANMVSAANFPYLYGGGHTQPARWGPFDCSGSVSYVMQQAGYKVPTTVSGDIPSWGFPAGPGRVTIFYNASHTFMRIGDRYFGTSGFARPGGGAGWFDVDRLPAGYLAGFKEVHVTDLGPDSFSSTVQYVWPRPAAGPWWTDPMRAPRLIFERGQR